MTSSTASLFAGPRNSVELWQKAASFATQMHAKQMRKDDVTPYVAHPFRVALTVLLVFQCEDPVAICTALLHDVIEDTAGDYDDLCKAFGPDIADAVACLSKDQRLPEESREPDFYRQIAAGPWQARLVKLADAYDNICDAVDDRMRGKAVSKGYSAIKSAGADPRLDGAVQALRELIEAHSSS